MLLLTYSQPLAFIVRLYEDRPLAYYVATSLRKYLRLRGFFDHGNALWQYAITHRTILIRHIRLK